MKRLLIFAASLGLAASVVFALFCLAARLFWAFELFTHYQFYWALNAVLVALLFVVTACPKRAVGALLLAVFFSWKFVPYYLPKAETASGEEPTARVMLFNVLVSNRRYEDVLEFIREQDADVLVIQEFEPGWRTALLPLESTYPHRIYEVRRGADAIAVFSKFPLSGIQWDPSQDGEWPIVSTTVDVDGKPLRLVALHPPPPVRQRNADLRNERLKTAGYIASEQGATIVVGDLNCSPWSPHFRDLVKNAKLRDSSLGRGITPTWHLFSGLAIPIDHVLHSEDVRVLSREVGPDLGSDHRAVVVDIALP